MALYVAAKQLGTVKDERTVKLIEEASSTMEGLLGFFDFAADVRVSREAFSSLYKRLIRARPVELRTEPTEDVATVSKAVLALIEDVLDEAESGARDTVRERELRKRILAVSNFLERVSTLIEKKVISEKLFLQNQDYNIVATYYVLEPIFQDLQSNEGFDFNDARRLAVKAPALPHLASRRPRSATGQIFRTDRGRVVSSRLKLKVHTALRAGSVAGSAALETASGN